MTKAGNLQYIISIVTHYWPKFEVVERNSWQNSQGTFGGLSRIPVTWMQDEKVDTGVKAW